AVAEDGADVWLTAADSGGELRVSPPSAFDGSDREISPEELFALAIANCIVSTYRAVAARKGLAYDAVTADIETTLDRAGDEGRPEITHADVTVTVDGVADTDLAREIGTITDRSCFVSRSVTTDIATDYRFPGPEQS
ncbi:MAG: OsmC family protein, partial [Candidatus Nanohaloarchaea archaeon]